MRKVLASGLALWLWLASVAVAAAQTAAPVGSIPQRLGLVEQALYGREQDGSLINRIERLEQDLYGQPQSGPLLVRVEKMASFVTTSGLEGGSLKLRLNAMEWVVFQRLSDGQPVLKRLDQLEAGVLGEVQKGKPIAARVKTLLDMVWPGGSVHPVTVTVPKQTLIRIKLLSPVTSAKNQVGDAVPFEVVDDVILDNKLAIPAGSQGVGRVTAVDSAGRLGKDGRLQIDFGSVPAIDGTPIRLSVDQRATEQNKSLELAAGASMAGVILLGPIGLVGGYFVRGQDVTIESNRPFYVEVKDAVPVTAVSLVGAPR